MHLLLFILGLLLPAFVSANFGFFEQMFQGHGGGYHQQQQHHRAGGASAWAAQSEAVQCAQYLCPKTLDCVDAPAACPCPNPEDIRCLVGDAQDKKAATVFCVRGELECADVERLAAR